MGSDSHTPTAGGVGMLAFGAGGLDVALAMAGALLPGHARGSGGQPERAISGLGVRQGHHPGAFAPSDRLRGATGKILEYFGPALAHLVRARAGHHHQHGGGAGGHHLHLPADAQTRRFMALQGRDEDFRPLKALGRPDYAEIQEVDLDQLAPLIARPSSPDRVAPVKELEGPPVEQVLIGSCGNSSFRDLMVVAKALKGRRVHPRVSLEINPGSRQVLENLALAGGLLPLLEAGARLMPPGCWGCIGVGQAPPSHARVGAHLSPEFLGAQRHQR